MNFYKKIIEFCSSNLEEENYGDNSFKQALLTNIVNFTLFTALLISSIFTFIFSSASISLILIFASAIFVINFLVIVRLGRINTAKNIVFTVISLLFVLLVNQRSSHSGIIYLFLLYPILNSILFGLRKGSLYSIGFVVFALALLLLPLGNFVRFSASSSENIFFAISFLAILLLYNLQDFIRNREVLKAEQALIETKSSLKSKEDFISKLSHQIRTPLNNIVVITNMVNETNLDKDLKDLVDTIHASTNNLVNVVNNIVEVSNYDMDDTINYNIDFSIYSTINNTLKLFASQYDNKVSFNFSVASDIPENLNGDPIKLKQIFLNLVENILKNKISDTITVDIDVTKNIENKGHLELLFLVRSNKPIHIPIDINHNKFITNPKNLKKENTSVYINLLDLNIANRLIEENGGRLNISSTPDSTTFSFLFSLRVGGETKLSTPIKETRTESKLPPIRNGKKVKLNEANVLLVEDNLINQKIVVLSLKKLVGNIEIANNGKEALDRFAKSKYDIILMDIQMPIMNGIVTTKKIREIEASTSTHTPILAITANALLGDKEECLAAGMDDYISKPYQIEVLIKKMEKQLLA